jgi:hypothetical protein
MKALYPLSYCNYDGKVTQYYILPGFLTFYGDFTKDPKTILQSVGTRHLNFWKKSHIKFKIYFKTLESSLFNIGYREKSMCKIGDFEDREGEDWNYVIEKGALKYVSNQEVIDTGITLKTYIEYEIEITPLKLKITDDKGEVIHKIEREESTIDKAAFMIQHTNAETNTDLGYFRVAMIDWIWFKIRGINAYRYS